METSVLIQQLSFHNWVVRLIFYLLRSEKLMKENFHFKKQFQFQRKRDEGWQQCCFSQFFLLWSAHLLIGVWLTALPSLSLFVSLCLSLSLSLSLSVSLSLSLPLCLSLSLSLTESLFQTESLLQKLVCHSL